MSKYTTCVVWQVPHQQKPKLPAHVERAALLTKHKPESYAMLSDDSSDDTDSDSVITATANQVSIFVSQIVSFFFIAFM